MKRFSKRQVSYLFIIVIVILSFFLGFLVKEVFFGEKQKLNKSMSSVDAIIKYNANLSYTQQVFNHCSVKENATEKFFCVNQYVVQNFNNVPREGVYSIDDLFEKGADCKSYAVYYATLAKMMGYDYLFIQLPNHIFTMVYFKEGYCILDQKFYDCFYYEENLSEELSNE